MNNHPHNANADERRDDFDHGDGTDRPAEMAGGAELDGLLRDWHEANRRAAAAGRDRLLEALRSGKASQGPDQTETEAEATEQRESDSATRPGQPPMLPAMPARRHSPTLRRVQGSPRRGWGGRSGGGGMARFGVLIAAMLAIAVIVPQLVPSRLTPTFDTAAYAGTTTLSPEGGRLDAIDAQGEPIGPFVLKRTEVDAQVTGRFVRVNVRQRYHNPYARKIEAVYTFPLSDDGAVDRMTMTIGSRVIEGEVHERDEAREIYEAARESGRVASLLEQERANIFTQSVANIEPGAEIVIDVSYVETLTERDGEFSFAFPTTVAPRYIPGIGPDGRAQVPDASRITPAYAHPDGETVARPHAAPNKDGADRDLVPGLDYGVMNEASRNGTKTVIEDSAGAGAPSVRPGNDLSISVKIDTGGPGITGIESPLHATSRTDWQSRADGNPRIVGIALTQAKEIANRDFVLKWRQTSDTVQESVFTHSGAQGNFLGVMLQPPSKVVESAVVPRELVFVLDTSGSMSGAPLDAAKRVMNLAIAGMRPVDRFNVVTFAGHTSVLWDSPRRATQENIGEAMRLVDSRQGGGGTEMMKAIDAALVQTPIRNDDRDSRVRPLRIVMFLTDGEVGNDMAIIDAIQKNRGTTRVFSFGVGNSVNRYLLNGAARAGGGAAEFVLLPRDGQGPSESEINEVVDRFTRRTTTPILTNITVEPSPNLPLFDPHPDLRNIPDVFDVTPVTILARYADLAHPVSGTLTIRGNTAAGPWQKVIPITLPATGTAPANDVLATLWARRQVESLLSQDLTGAQRGYVSPEIREAIVKIGEEFSIMSPYTSFVAVDKLRVTIDGEPQLINIPVHIPDQTNWENYFGLEESQLQSTAEYLRADKVAEEDETRKLVSQMIQSAEVNSAQIAAKPSATSGAAATQAPPVDAAASARGATASPPAPASPPASVASPAPVLAEIAPGGGSGGESGAGDRVAPRSPAGDGRAERKEAASKQGPARREQQKGERATRESGLTAGAVGGSQMTPTTGTQSKGRGTSTFGRDISSGNTQDKDYRHATMTIESSPVVGDSAVGFDPAISQSELEQHDLVLQRLSALRFSNAGNEEALSLQHSQQVLPRQMLAAAEVVRNSRLAQMSQADGLDDNTRANIQRSVQAVQTAPEEPLVQRWNAVASLPEQQAMLAQVAQVEREARAEFNLYAQAVNKVSPPLAAALDPEWLKTNRSNLAAQRTSPRQFSVPSFDNTGVQPDSDAVTQAMPRDENVQQNVSDQAGASSSQANQISAQSSLSQPLNTQSIFVVQDPLLVVVLVSDLTARHIQELRSAGLEILSTSREDKVAVGRLHLEDLKRMTELAFVLRIEPAEPVGAGTNVRTQRQQRQFQQRP